MRQVTMTKLLLSLSMPWVAFCLMGVLGLETVSKTAMVALWIWVSASLGSLAIPSSINGRGITDLAGALVLTSLTGWTSSPFVPVLLLVIALSGALHGGGRAKWQASIAILVLVAGSLLSAEVSSQAFPWFQPLALALALYGLAWLGGCLKGSWLDLEEQHEQILKALEEGIIVCDATGRVVQANPAARQFLRFPESRQWTGFPLEQILRRETDAAFRKALTNPSMHAEDVRWSDREGVERSFRVKTTALDSGLILSVFTDRTAERRAIEAEARLVHLEELDELSLGLAHEIRNPLASLRGAAEELSGGRLNTKQSELMSRIVNRESDRLDRTVNRFLEYSSRRNRDQFEICDASTGVFEVLEMIQQRSDCDEMCIQESIESPIHIGIERDAWNSIVSNLVINAVEACQGQGRLELSLTAMDGMAHFFITDDGPGISEDLQDRVFHPFVTTKSREGGLGLAIVRKAVEESGGRIELDSQENEGTTIRVSVPLAQTRNFVKAKAGSA